VSSAVSSLDTPARLRIVCVVPFLNEAKYLSTFLESLVQQRRLPDRLVLVDDGSTDSSPQLAADFAAVNEWATLWRRPLRPAVRDRLAEASELRAFLWAVAKLDEPFDVVAKLDADLRLSEDLLSTIEHAFQRAPELGVAGGYLSTADPATGQVVREPCDPKHVRGATKFYRRACFEQIAPIEPLLGWDTIDEVTARTHGWRTLSLTCPEGDSIHLRATGSANGLIRAQYRWGMCAYGIGQHPLWVVLSALRRLSARPRLLSSPAFLAGWATAGLRRHPRAAGSVRACVREEELAALRRGARAAFSRSGRQRHEAGDGPPEAHRLTADP
jgi:poly-beta-1,6-N-acetyl-D-glucosamine synthase